MIQKISGRFFRSLRNFFASGDSPLYFPPDLEHQKGKGFVYRDKEFVHHSSLHHGESALESLVLPQRIFFFGLASVLILGLVIDWHTTLILLLGSLIVLYFSDLLFTIFLTYRSFSKSPEIHIPKQDIARISKETLPLYTIFCPLYKEAEVMPQFLKAMNELDYPADKLQILLLLEEDDTETIEKIRSQRLPAHFEIVIVPHSAPKTKPKAMNYGLAHATGEYVVIYDAEDIPEPDQLKKAVLAFSRTPKDTVCVQAKLNFYNAKQNLLTRLFAAEYSLWFDLVLPGLQSVHAPIPLGGTSNHFRARDLRLLGGWDAFNVTEDCDLGMRLVKQGYRTAIMDSTTYEEANASLGNWFRQRSRWIKGYMQTYLVHMRKPRAFWQPQRSHHLPLFQLIVGGKVLSIFVNPVMWALTASYFLFRAQTGDFIESLFPPAIFYLGVVSFIFGNFLYMYSYMMGAAKRRTDWLIKYGLLVPFYWIGMSIAMWRALYELLFKPHYWAKTTHGLHLPIEHERPLHALGKYASYIKRISKTQTFSAASILVGSLVFANAMNFVFSAFLGRQLSLEQFGLLAVLNTMAFLMSIFIAALAITINHRTAYIAAKHGAVAGVAFLQSMRRRWLLIGFGLSFLWVAATPFLADYFHTSEYFILLSLAPILVLGMLAAINRGFLHGNLLFLAVAMVIISEAIGKFAAAAGFVAFGLAQWVAFAIPFSIGVSFLTSWFFATRTARRITKATATQSASVPPGITAFPRRFFAASLLNGLSLAIFLSLDLILAKHYLSVEDAGRYALLSIIGKMIFFAGTLLNTFIVTFVSRAEGEGKNPNTAFYRLLPGIIISVFGAFLLLGPLGFFTIPLFLGAQAAHITPFVLPYAFALSVFTVASSFVVFHLARRHYIFPAASLCIAGVMAIGISISHDSIPAIIHVLFATSIAYFALIVLLHLLQRNGRFVASNLVGLLNVLHPLPPAAAVHAQGKRILILNWRDTKHKYAGGAEVYIHELAKRWVQEGNQVTIFCGNDGNLPRNETIEGVQVMRRGGSYFVYIWAFLYYICKFRGRYDAIIDCENGIPFFAPLYAKEQVFCLVHHVHQEVFRKHLKFPMAQIASVLENRLMPWTYTDKIFITVSESSKKEIQQWSLATKDIQVLSPGVDLETLQPGEKSPIPMVLYLGRLKAYKSVDTLIRAFASLSKQVPASRLVIAGDGEERHNLEELTNQLGMQEKVHFLGKVSEQQKVRLLQQAWVFANPSMIEGWGITSIEAAACGTPVVASDVPGLRDSVQNPHTGFLVPYGKAEAMAERIEEIIVNEELRSFMNEQARQWARRFDWRRTSNSFLSIIGK